jgi:hypothetical protein
MRLQPRLSSAGDREPKIKGKEGEARRHGIEM